MENKQLLGDFLNAHPWVASVIILFSIIIVSIVIITVLKKKDLFISDGKLKLIEPPKTIKYSTISTNDIKECIKFLEEKKEKLMDDIFGIKNRIFKQSKDYAKSRVVASRNKVVELYKEAYIETYFKSEKSNTKATNVSSAGRITKEEIETKKGKQIASENINWEPCEGISECTLRCKSGLTYFESKIMEDFKPITEEVYKVIENNHLINKEDLEFDEEIKAKAIDLSTTLRNKVMAYELPVDSIIAKIVLDRQLHDIQEAIIDGLRNSRVLSKRKRDEIEKLQKEYDLRKEEKLIQIFDKISEENRKKIIEKDNI